MEEVDVPRNKGKKGKKGNNKRKKGKKGKKVDKVTNHVYALNCPCCNMRVNDHTNMIDLRLRAASPYAPSYAQLQSPSVWFDTEAVEALVSALKHSYCIKVSAPSTLILFSSVHGTLSSIRDGTDPVLDLSNQLNRASGVAHAGKPQHYLPFEFLLRFQIIVVYDGFGYDIHKFEPSLMYFLHKYGYARKNETITISTHRESRHSYDSFPVGAGIWKMISSSDLNSLGSNPDSPMYGVLAMRPVPHQGDSSTCGPLGVHGLELINDVFDSPNLDTNLGTFAQKYGGDAESLLRLRLEELNKYEVRMREMTNSGLLLPSATPLSPRTWDKKRSGAINLTHIPDSPPSSDSSDSEDEDEDESADENGKEGVLHEIFDVEQKSLLPASSDTKELHLSDFMTPPEVLLHHPQYMLRTPPPSLSKKLLKDDAGVASLFPGAAAPSPAGPLFAPSPTGPFFGSDFYSGVVTTPVRNTIAKVTAASLDPHHVQTTLEHVEYGPIAPMVAQVPLADVKRFLQVVLTGPSRSMTISWVCMGNGQNRCDRNRYYQKIVMTLLPHHITMRFNNAACIMRKSNKGARSWHGLTARLTGWCCARSDGCPSEIACGYFMKDLLLAFSANAPKTTAFHVLVKGSCRHKRHAKIGELRGDRRQEVVDDYILSKKKPGEFTKEKLNSLSSAQYHAKNGAHTVSDTLTTYNIAREAREQGRESRGLTKDKLANILLVSHSLQERDLEGRKERKDPDTKILGILRYAELVPAVKYYLWTRECLLMFHHFGLTERMVVYIDATGALLSQLGSTSDLFHTKLCIHPKNALLSMFDNEMARNLLSPLVIAELISSSNSTEDVLRWLVAFIKDLRRLFPNSPLVKPLWCMSDCAGQLQAGVLQAFTEAGKVSNRVQYCNVLLAYQLHYSSIVREHRAGPERKAKATKLLAELRCLVDIFIHECRVHVIAAPKNWSTRTNSKHGGDEFAGGRMKSILVSHFRDITRLPKTSEVIVKFSVLMAMILKQSFDFPPYSTDTPTREAHDPHHEEHLAKQMQEFVERESKLLELSSAEDRDAFLSGTSDSMHCTLHAGIVSKALYQLRYLSSYLKSCDHGNKTGVVRYSVVWGYTCDDDGGNLSPLKSGGFERIVSLPVQFPIRNPLHSSRTATYLDEEWMKKVPMFSVGLIHCCEASSESNLQDNNQLSEAVIKHCKHDQDIHEWLSEPAEYFIKMYDDAEKANRRAMAQYEGLRSSFEARRDRAAKKSAAKNTVEHVESALGLTDAQRAELEEAKQMIWSRKGSNTEMNTLAINEIKKLMPNKPDSKRHSNMVAFVEVVLKEEKKSFMSYPTFNEFMKGKRKGRLTENWERVVALYAQWSYKNLQFEKAVGSDQPQLK